MNQNIIELFAKNFDFAFKAVTYNNMIVALKAFEQFKKQNEDFFTLDKRETLFGYLRTYSIERQFNDSAFNPKANYSVSMKEVNNYKYKAICIDTNDFIVNIGATKKPTMLLPKSSYKKEFAKANLGYDTQYSLDFSSNEDVVVRDCKKYAQISYGYLFGDLKHLEIIMPDYKYKKIEYSLNLLENISVYTNYIPQELIEESIVSLKKSIRNEAEKAQ